MSAVVFLLLALVIIIVGSVAVYLRQRTPSSLDAGIEGFRREMDALAVRHGNGRGAAVNGHGRAGAVAEVQAGTDRGPGTAVPSSSNGNGDGRATHIVAGDAHGSGMAVPADGPSASDAGSVNGHGNGHGSDAGGSDGTPGMSEVSTTAGVPETAGPPGPPGPVEGEG
jgi:hypothetical protein